LFRCRRAEIIKRRNLEPVANRPISSPVPAFPSRPAPIRKGILMVKLSEPEILERMATAKGWERHGDMLVRSWQFPSFRRALEFVNHVAALAEKYDHHPDIILSYRLVRLEMSTHSEGGLTATDFAFASEINALPSDR
jgi:4a-hydroxytetrahydrobiopterin dehydratase